MLHQPINGKEKSSNENVNDPGTIQPTLKPTVHFMHSGFKGFDGRCVVWRGLCSNHNKKIYHNTTHQNSVRNICRQHVGAANTDEQQSSGWPKNRPKQIQSDV